MDNSKHDVIKLLVGMSNADGRMKEMERLFIYNAAYQIGLMTEEVDDILLDAEMDSFHPPASEGDRMTILYYLLFLMRVDGIVHKAEENFCHKAGLRLGFNPQLTSELIEIMKKYIKKDIPPNLMLDHIRKYLN